MKGIRPTTGAAYTAGAGHYVPRTVRIEDGDRIAGERRVHADACVIGAGAGGAVVAKELAEGGMRVVVLEEGERHGEQVISARPREAFPVLYRDAGQTTTIGVPPIVLPLGHGVGGTTFVNSGTCFRTPAHVLERWHSEQGLEFELDPFFRRVEREVNVVQVPAHVAGRSAALAKRGADALGWSGDYLYRNVRGCVGSGVCAFGCPTNAKQHTGVTYMPKAWDAGATTFTRVRARRIETRRGRARAVEARAAGGGRVRVEADHVVVATGTIHTPGLLARNRLGGASGWLGRNLSIHPATAVWALFDERVDLATGVPQAYCVDEFAREGIMMEGAGGPPDYVAMAAPYTGDRQRELMLRYPHLAQFGLMVSDRSRGRVHSRLGRPIVRYELCDEDVATFKRGLERMVELWWAAGAERVLLPLGRVRELQHADTAPLRDLRLRASDLKLMAFHPLGTARAHADPRHGVVDGNGQVHGVEGLHVADGSAVPSALGVNPQITIMTLATRLAFHLLGASAPEHEPHPETLPHVLSD
jgi:choline dehydrogenase-like flavoprotein